MPPRTRNPKALKASRGAAIHGRTKLRVNRLTSMTHYSDYNCEGWEKESAARYNRLLAAEILPTRFAHVETLADLGLESDVFETLDVMGLTPLCYQALVLYPDSVRQELATAQITYQNPTAPTYENCSFSFMADGKFCSISLHDLNDLLEIADTPREVSIENKFTPANAFWDLIATGKFTSRKAYQSQIRNPTLRIIAKIVSNILFAKELTSKVTNGELQVLYTGLEDEIRRDRVIPIQAVKTNPGFLLISMLSERKDSLLRTEDKKDRCGSVLTPLFKRFNINLDSYKVVPELEYIDTAYLITCHILRDESTYKFADKEGDTLYCKLPLPGLTNFMTLENIVFLPDAEHLCDDPRAPVPNENADMDDVVDVTPSADSAYDLEDLTDVTDDHAYRRWMVDSQKKNNSLMKRILRAITRGCIGSQDEQTTQGTRRPGKEPAGTSTGEERLPRNRRTAGHSSSGDSD
ncbi:hypothetical protein IGI04_023239 [Brassica rapa subsp. trilocularis]|uniref:Arabidopsis retrotransposon Orf1 C-terminal domain-containing protein n=1 Tax=Brassica rapa subsp. trilocularis TaxID=1813537 RepID=A0ABQ7M7H1_BRACM|nr:hypothetical protein IGI04_023239 [Brassica rapa subsp. trilocularis]